MVVLEEETCNTPCSTPGESDGSIVPLMGLESWEAMRVLSRL